MPNLTLYTTTAFLILDSDGQRVLAKYYRPKGSPYGDTKGLTTLKEQKSFEKGLWEKTKKAGSDIILYEGHLAVYKHATDLIFYIIGNAEENELMLSLALNSFYDALTVLLRNQVERRAVLENYDLGMLCLDETIDDGVIVETDSTTIASRVSRPRADATDIVINEQTIMNAYQTVKEKMQQRIQQL
ncbi:coatomer protein [Phellopilus nigrolimitatus]|nr:coatomer protein [Phellopilus nigrolimitatus]